MRIFFASLAIAACGILPAAVHAQVIKPIETEVVIPGQPTDVRADNLVRGKVADLAKYIGFIYNFLISIVGVLAAVMIMIGGFQYLTSGGDATRAGAGKKRITNALAGLVLALLAYTILNTISPDLVDLKVPTIPSVTREGTVVDWCEWAIKRGEKVTPVMTGQTGCGAIGEYGGSYCLYYGEEHVGNTRSGFPGKKVCLQANVNGAQVAKMADEYKTKKTSYKTQGAFVSCASLSRWRPESWSPLGYPLVGADVCKKWWITAKEGLKQRISKAEEPMYCGWDAGIGGCYQAHISCQDIGIDCGNYDTKVDGWGYEKSGSRVEFENINDLEGMGSSGDGLIDVCGWNPCMANNGRCAYSSTSGQDCNNR